MAKVSLGFFDTVELERHHPESVAFEFKTVRFGLFLGAPVSAHRVHA